MPFLVERNEGVIEVRLLGAVEVRDLAEVADAVDQLDRETPSLDRLVDTTGVTAAGLNFAAMVRFADDRSRWSPTHGVRTAIVAPTDVAFGFARMFQDLLRQGVTVRVFRRRDEAVAWLETPRITEV